MSALIEMANKKFNKLSVIAPLIPSKGRYYWLCRCECGRLLKVVGAKLRNGNTKSCGHFPCNLQYDLKGQRFNRLTVFALVGRYERGNSPYWWCVCDCGGEVVTTTKSLRNGDSQSCGCLHKEKFVETLTRLRPTWKGEQHPAYKKDKDPQARAAGRLLLGYEEWRVSVFGRDEYVCQYCGQRGGTLNAHHLDSYQAHPERRLDVSNGVTLCKACHNRFHSIYGKKVTTAAQFLEFIDQGMVA